MKSARYYYCPEKQKFAHIKNNFNAKLEALNDPKEWVDFESLRNPLKTKIALLMIDLMSSKEGAHLPCGSHMWPSLGASSIGKFYYCIKVRYE
jgi:hypothetical protein